MKEIKKYTNDLSNLEEHYFIDLNYKLQGIYKYYGGNKNPVNEQFYIDGKMHGIYKSWFTHINNIETRVMYWILTNKYNIKNGIEITFNF